MIDLVCFKCGCKMDGHGEFEEDDYSQPMLSGGMWFSSRGGGQSRAFDPLISKDFLLIAVCDDCVVQHQEQIVLVSNIVSKMAAKVSKFDSEK